MSTRQIQTTGEQTACDVCGRTLLRGERAETYLSGGSRRSVCELCTDRARHEGWVREGTLPDLGASDGAGDRRRSLLARLRARREATAARPGRRQTGDGERSVEATGRRAELPSTSSEPGREPRHVRAVPTNAEHRIAAAIDTFNGSEHCRTVAGVARSLGAPAICVRPSAARASVVEITVIWELCWYRYEVDLSDDHPSVRLTGQGYELGEVSEEEGLASATADERGQIELV